MKCPSTLIDIALAQVRSTPARAIAPLARAILQLTSGHPARAGLLVPLAYAHFDARNWRRALHLATAARDANPRLRVAVELLAAITARCPVAANDTEGS